jgi:uncharacterized membrane protein YhhN
MMFAWLGITLVALVVLLVGEAKGLSGLKAAAKATASTGFILFAIYAGALGTPYGRLILLGLALSWFGDIFLLSRSPQFFQAGLVSFLLAHVAYGASFVFRGQNAASALVTLALIAIVAFFVLRWLLPHVTGDMRKPVLAYIIVISTMVTLAAGTYGRWGNGFILVGAIAFYLSDVSVARDRFVAPGYKNALWGLPLYYGGQLLLAYSVVNA